MNSAQGRKLSPRATELLDASSEERIAHIKKQVFIPYPRAKAILDEMEQLLIHPVSHRPPNILIVARSQNGKTELLREFLSRHPAQELREGDAIYAPVLYLQSPPGPDERVFLRSALELLGVEAKYNEDPGEMLVRVVNVLRKVKTKVLLLDELNSMLAGSVRKQLFMMNMLKYISNATNISIVAAGTKDAAQILSTDEQLESRFPSRPLPRWEETGTEFGKLLASFEFILPLRKTSNLQNIQIRKLVYGLSEGLIGGAAKTIKDGAVSAIESGEESITEALLQKYAAVLKQRKEDEKNL